MRTEKDRAFPSSPVGRLHPIQLIQGRFQQCNLQGKLFVYGLVHIFSLILLLQTAVVFFNLHYWILPSSSSNGAFLIKSEHRALEQCFFFFFLWWKHLSNISFLISSPQFIFAISLSNYHRSWCSPDHRKSNVSYELFFCNESEKHNIYQDSRSLDQVQESNFSSK